MGIGAFVHYADPPVSMLSGWEKEELSDTGLATEST